MSRRNFRVTHQIARNAKHGSHWTASHPIEPTFSEGDKVRLKNGMITTVKGKTDYGYTLEGIEGYFDAVRMTPV